MCEDQHSMYLCVFTLRKQYMLPDTPPDMHPPTRRAFWQNRLWFRAWLDWDTEWFRSKVCISINHFSLSLFWHGTINANSSATDATQILQESLMEYFDGILILNGLLLKRVYLLHKIIHIISFKIKYIIAKSMLCFGGTCSTCKCWLQMYYLYI